MYNKDARSMKELIGTLVKQLGLSEQVLEQNIKTDWAEIIGEIAANKINVCYLKSKVLHLESSASVWTNELILRKTEIINKINFRYSNIVVNDITFH